MKYKVGNKVRVRRDLEIRRYGERTAVKKMLEFKGKVVTIAEAFKDCYEIKEDDGRWHWTDEMLEDLEYTYEDLCNSPLGTKITFESDEILVKSDTKNEFIWQSSYTSRSNKNLEDLKDNFGDLGKIIKVEKPTYATIYEQKLEVLDEKEKEYLRNVIKPFKNRVDYIYKYAYPTGKEDITIVLDDFSIAFPEFDKGTMYKGMEEKRKYTLEELGL